MTNPNFSAIIDGLSNNLVAPYLGPSVLLDVKSKLNGIPISADSDSLILSMNLGKPMAPKLMYEFPRAALNQELNRGRSFVSQFLDKTYRDSKWTIASFHTWLAAQKPHYIIDINRDTKLHDVYADVKHTLIVGLARITGTDYRFKLYQYDSQNHAEITDDFSLKYSSSRTNLKIL